MKRTLALLTLFFGLPLLALAQPNPSPQDTNGWRDRPCRDPWINMAFAFHAGGLNALRGTGDLGMCNAAHYNNARWNSFAELVRYVKEAQRGWANAGIEPTFLQLRNGARLDAFASGNTPVYLIGNDAGSIVAAGGGNLVAAGGGNIVAAGGGNIVAAGGGNIVAAGGGNLTMGVARPSRYAVQSGRSVRGGGSTVFQLLGR